MLCSVFVDAGGEHWPFTTIDLPAVPAKLSPPDASGGHGGNAALAWHVPGSPSAVRLCYDDLINEGCDGTWIDVAGSANYVLTSLEANAIYEWQVRACADALCSDADGGSYHRFSALLDFTKRAPFDGNVVTDVQAWLTWESAGGVVNHYRYCFAEAPSSCNPSFILPRGVTDTLGGPFNRGITYTWQVRACTGSACSDADEGESWEFIILSPLEVIASAQKVLLSATPRYYQDALYAIYIANTIGQEFVFTLTEQVPPSATLSVSAVEATAPITYIGLIGGAPSWLVAIPANAFTQITVPVRYQPRTMGKSSLDGS